MRTLLRVVVAALAAAFVIASATNVRAQRASAPCVLGADSMVYQLSFLTDVVVKLPSWVASAYNLPYQPAAGLTPVTDESICNQALTAYNSLPSGPDVSHVVTIKVGTDRYVVTGPAQDVGGLLYVVYDTSFTRLGAILH